LPFLPFAVAFVFLLYLRIHPKTRVIPTGVAHGTIVSSVVEGPPHFAFAFVVVVALALALAFLAVIPEKPVLSEVEWRICFCLLPLQLFSPKTAQKSLVKPPKLQKTR
jgi:hypothetical protein